MHRPWFIAPSTVAVVALAHAAVAQSADSLSPPTRLWAAQTAIGQITLAWKPVSGATGYVLHRDAGNAGGAEGRAKVADLAGNVSHYVYVVRAAPQHVQQFYLEATDANGRVSPKAAFNPVTLVTTPVAAVPPASVTAKETSPGVITVTWTSAPGATAYTLGRIAGTSGLQALCRMCSTDPTYVDSGVTNGTRYQYSVAAMTPTAVSTRTMSNVVTPGVVATTGGTGGTGTTGGTPGGTSNTGGTTTDTTKTATTAADPLHGRYRVSLTGFTVQSQTYDHLLQIDGKGDEVFLATHVMQFDTTSTSLVVNNEVLTSKVYGDISGFSYRVKAGTAGLTGGLVSGNEFPPPKSLVGTGGLPMVLWEGELVQGRGAVLIVPTIWEWDDNPELFGNWLTGRHAFLSRLLKADVMASILLNQNVKPVEMGSPGLFVRTNMFGDPRDRPIGLKPGQPAADAGFFAPLDPRKAATYGTMSGSVVTSILANNPFATFAQSLLDKLFGITSGFAQSLGATNAKMPQASAKTLPGILATTVSAVIRQLSSVMSGVAQSQPGAGIQQLATVVRSASPSSLATDLYLFEQAIDITPASVQAALGASKTTGMVTIDVPYVDYSSLQGRYVLHLKLERLQ
jgi:hypothetical protein